MSKYIAKALRDHTAAPPTPSQALHLAPGNQQKSGVYLTQLVDRNKRVTISRV
jgi:hypothetical protein